MLDLSKSIDPALLVCESQFITRWMKAICSCNVPIARCYLPVPKCRSNWFVSLFKRIFRHHSKGEVYICGCFLFSYQSGPMFVHLRTKDPFILGPVVCAYSYVQLYVPILRSYRPVRLSHGSTRAGPMFLRAGPMCPLFLSNGSFLCDGPFPMVHKGWSLFPWFRAYSPDFVRI